MNLQKWSEPLVSCTSWLRNVLRATTAYTFSTSEPPKVARTCGVLYILTWKSACTFSTSELPRVVRSWCALYILTWKCASRHNGVHFFDISLEFTKEHKTSFFRGCASSRLDEAQPSAWEHNQRKAFIAQKWAWLRPQTLGCASSRLDEAQPRKIMFYIVLVNSSA